MLGDQCDRIVRAAASVCVRDIEFLELRVAFGYHRDRLVREHLDAIGVELKAASGNHLDRLVRDSNSRDADVKDTSADDHLIISFARISMLPRLSS